SEASTMTGPLALPTGVAVDDRDHLYVWEGGCLLIWDLERGRLRERLQPGFQRPVDLAWNGGQLLRLGPQLPGMVEQGAGCAVRVRALPELEGEPHRIAVDGRDRCWLLLDAGSDDARLAALDVSVEPAVPGASDLLFLRGSDEAEDLVVARGPNQQF